MVVLVTNSVEKDFAVQVYTEEILPLGTVLCNVLNEKEKCITVTMIYTDFKIAKGEGPKVYIVKDK